MALSACDFLQGYFYFVVGLRAFRYNDELFCEAHAYVALWSATASFLWTACLTAYVAAFFWRGLPAKLNRAPARRTVRSAGLSGGAVYSCIVPQPYTRDGVTVVVSTRF